MDHSFSRPNPPISRGPSRFSRPNPPIPGKRREPSFPYPKKDTVYFHYLGRFNPEPNWKRWLSPFHHKTSQKAFSRGICVKKKSIPPFFLKLTKAVKRRLSRGYRVRVLTRDHTFDTKVSVKYTQEGRKWLFYMIFEDGHWESSGFDWGKTVYLDFWILLQRRPDQPKSMTSITFLIEEPLEDTEYIREGLKACKEMDHYVREGLEACKEMDHYFKMTSGFDKDINYDGQMGLRFYKLIDHYFGMKSGFGKNKTEYFGMKSRFGKNKTEYFKMTSGFGKDIDNYCRMRSKLNQVIDYYFEMQSGFGKDIDDDGQMGLRFYKLIDHYFEMQSGFGKDIDNYCETSFLLNQNMNYYVQNGLEIWKNIDDYYQLLPEFYNRRGSYYQMWSEFYKRRGSYPRMALKFCKHKNHYRRMGLQNVWPKFYEAVDKYNKKYQNKYGVSLPQQIINEFRANFCYKILVPFRKNFCHRWGFDLRLFSGTDKKNYFQLGKFCADHYNRIVRDPTFGGRYTKTLQKFQMIGSDLAIEPWAMSLWMTVQEILNSKFKEIGVEKWDDVRSDNPANQDDVLEVVSPGNYSLSHPIETTTYSAFRNSIQELPFRRNWWCQVVIKDSETNPIPLLSCHQFPYQKAYSAFATKMEADAEILEILELYRQLFEEFLAVPIIKCKVKRLSRHYYTTTVETFLSNPVWSIKDRQDKYKSYSLEGACSIQGATAHCLDQNGTEKLIGNGEKVTTWLNSWSCSIRVIGLMVMVHGNANVLVLPPKAAPIQVIVTSRVEINNPEIRDSCNTIVETLCKEGIRAVADLDNFPSSTSCWEDKGVPLLIKVGPEVLNHKQVETHRRDNKDTVQILMTCMVEEVKKILHEIQESMFEAAKRRQDACIQTVQNWHAFVEAVDNMKIMLTPWCDEEVVEKYVKGQIGLERNGHGVEILCSPLEQPNIYEDTQCFASGKPAKKWVYWGRKLLD